jgi:hypothetical protein
MPRKIAVLRIVDGISMILQLQVDAQPPITAHSLVKHVMRTVLCYTIFTDGLLIFLRLLGVRLDEENSGHAAPCESCLPSSSNFPSTLWLEDIRYRSDIR